MQNLNQIRARHVLKFASDEKRSDEKRVVGKNGGEVIKKIPPVLMNNGLLAALAYAMDERNETWRKVFDGIAKHLSSSEIAMVPQKCSDAKSLLEHLTQDETKCDVLRVVTDEAGAWLNFARRLVN